MMTDPVDLIARAVLYEGYLLYPYRPSSLKNRQRFSFGVLYPERYSAAQRGGDAWSFQAQCPVRGEASTRVRLSVRFLQLVERCDVRSYGTAWQEGIERQVDLAAGSLGELQGSGARHEFDLPLTGVLPPPGPGVRERLPEDPEDVLRGDVEVDADEIRAGAWRLSVRVSNRTRFDGGAADRAEALVRSLASAHVVLRVDGGRLVSVTDPPDDLRDVAAACTNIGVWPVLVAEEGRGDCMLASPIILDDHPQIAPESAGDLFDGTEIDEILALRILTMTDEEKREARQSDDRVRQILERTEGLSPDQWAKLHGAVRGLREDQGAAVMNESAWRQLEERTPVASLAGGKGALDIGSRVRLRPRVRGGDVLDMLLAGKTAVVEAIEQDYEGAFHVALVFDDDPGRDLGFLRQPGHRFFYAPEELDLLEPDIAPPPAEESAPTAAIQSILVAGIGNIFLGDDGFGVEVARRLAGRALPPGVRVVDYGIRGLDLTYALMDGPDVTILVDACPRGEAPGTLYVIEPDTAAEAADGQTVPDAHAMDPLAVIRAARSMGGSLKRILLVGCEPETLGPDEGRLGLSRTVAGAVEPAAELVLDLVRGLHDGRGRGNLR